jgi:biopolymer transport protein ExbD
MKNGLHHRGDAELNLIPLIDILSVMVAFLRLFDERQCREREGIVIPQ